jgi:glycosyltransferase involved in cell wall biosynthesis
MLDSASSFDRARPVFSVVVPAFNEAACIGAFHRRLADTMDQLGAWEAVYVNDGSQDATLAALHALRLADPHVAVVNLSRNFGKEIATTAGLDHAGGDAIIVIDADLQDPPEVIPAMVAAWRDGFDTVYAQRRVRLGETRLKRATAALFYRLMRHAGTTKWSYWKLWNFALEGITSFTVMPLKVATYIGVFVALLAVIYAAEVVVKKLLFGNAVPGYPSLMTVVLFLGGVQLVTLGVIGEYLGRVFNETKQRPLYLVEQYEPSSVIASLAKQERVG